MNDMFIIALKNCFLLNDHIGCPLIKWIIEYEPDNTFWVYDPIVNLFL